MPARILHVSDLHTGTREDPEVADALAALTARLKPDLIVATGDLTHRGRREQHERAAALLRGQGLAATLLTERAARTQTEVEVLDDLGGLVHHGVEFIGWDGRGRPNSPRLRPARGNA